MAAAAAWKVLARQQVEQAGGRFDIASGLLTDAHENLEEVRGVPVMLLFVGARVRRAEGRIAEASRELAAAASLARSAVLVALRGGAAPAAPAPDPAAAAPRLSIKDVPDEGLRAALTNLWKAAEEFGGACDLACISRSHLVGVLRLLDHPRPLPGGVPAVEGLVNIKLEDARLNLRDALMFARHSAVRLNDAIAALL